MSAETNVIRRWAQDRFDLQKMLILADRLENIDAEVAGAEQKLSSLNFQSETARATLHSLSEEVQTLTADRDMLLQQKHTAIHEKEEVDAALTSAQVLLAEVKEEQEISLRERDLIRASSEQERLTVAELGTQIVEYQRLLEQVKAELAQIKAEIPA